MRAAVIAVESQRPAPRRDRPEWADPASPGLAVWRCWSCNRTLAHYQPPIGLVAVVCQRCNARNELTTEDAQ